MWIGFILYLFLKEKDQLVQMEEYWHELAIPRKKEKRRKRMTDVEVDINCWKILEKGTFMGLDFTHMACSHLNSSLAILEGKKNAVTSASFSPVNAV